MCFCLPLMAMLLLTIWPILFSLTKMTIVACRRYFCENYNHCKRDCYCTIIFIIFSLRVNPPPTNIPCTFFHLTCHYSAESVPELEEISSAVEQLLMTTIFHFVLFGLHSNFAFVAFSLLASVLYIFKTLILSFFD